MKKISYFVFLFITFFFSSICVFASEIVVITGNEVRFRTEPHTGSNSGTITYLYSGMELTLLDKNAGSGNGCASSWYKVSYGSNIGYVCSQFAKIEVIEEINPDDYKEYGDYLKKLGFPDSYIPKLLELHAKYP